MRSLANNQTIDLIIRGTLLSSGIALVFWALSGDYLIGGASRFGYFQGAMVLAGLSFSLSAFLSTTAVSISLMLLLTGVAGGVLAELMLKKLVAPRFTTAFELNDRYLYGLRPNSIREYTHLPKNGGGTHLYRVNSDGFRGEELRKSNDGPRVVVYGDSFVHAEFSTLESSLPKRLEIRLRSLGHHAVEVVNAGVAGYGPDQILLRIKEEASWLKPDLILVGIYSGNDFGDLARNKLFRLNPGGRLVCNDFVLSDEIVHQAALAQHELLLRKVLRSSFRRSTSRRRLDPYERIEQALTQQLEEYNEFVHRKDNVVRELRSDPYSADIALQPGSASARFKVRLMEAVLARTQAVAQERGIPLVFFIIPHPMDVVGGKHSSGAVDIQKHHEYSPDRLINELLGICERNLLNCVNLMSTMRDSGSASLYLKGGDDHWNDNGQDVAAERLATEVDMILTGEDDGSATLGHSL